MDKVQVVRDTAKSISTLEIGGLESLPFAVRGSVTLQILFMAAPTNVNDWSGRRQWAKMLVLIALKRTENWSPMETDVGALCVVETVSMWWVKRFCPSISPKKGVYLPWTQVVARPLFTFQSNFDKNGVLYHIGTCGGTRVYQNPHTAGDVTVTWSSICNGSVDMFVEHRQSDSVDPCTTNVQNSWMQVDLGARTVRPTHYCLRNSSFV